MMVHVFFDLWIGDLFYSFHGWIGLCNSDNNLSLYLSDHVNMTYNIEWKESRSAGEIDGMDQEPAS